MTSMLNDSNEAHDYIEVHEDTFRQKTNDRKASAPGAFLGLPIVGFFRPRSVKTNLPGERSSMANNRNDMDNYGTHVSPDAPTTPLMKKARTAQQRWASLRRHVQHESFHIQDALKGSDDPAQKNEIHFDHVDLPYEFTLGDCFLALAAYLSISIIAFSFVFENWSVIDSMYFAVVTFTTIGYGDISPSTIGGRLFCVLFALSGVAVLAIALGVVGSKIVEAEVQSLSLAQSELVKDLSTIFRRFSSSRLEKQKGFAASHGGSGSRDSSSFSYLTEFDDPTLSLRDRADAILHPFSGIQRWCSSFYQMLRIYLPALTPLFAGSFVIAHYEGWNWEDTVYYCVVTTTTIGYGDLTPQQQSTKLFAVFFIPLAVGAMGHFLGTVANFIIEQRIRAQHKRLWKHELTLEDLQAMSTSANGVVTELDFLIFMLQAMKKVDSDLIDKIREHFHNLDLTHSGTLTRGDLELMAKRKLRSAHNKLHLADYKKELIRKGSTISVKRSIDEDSGEA